MTRGVASRKKKTLKVGIVGCGVHSSLTIFKSLTYVPVLLVAVCDIKKSRREKMALRYGARPYASVDDMLRDEELDAVFLVGPFEMHYKVGKKCLAAGKHVWVEKPPGISARQTKELVELSRRNKVFCQVGTHHRFAPAHRMAKEITARKDFGKLHAVDIRFSAQEYPGLRTFLLAHCIHTADLVQYFAGKVRSTVVRRSGQNSRRFSLQCLQNHSTGAVSSIHMTTLQSWGSPNLRVELTGVGQHVIVENATKLTYYQGSPIRPLVDSSNPGWLKLNHVPLSGRKDALTWQPNQSWSTVYSYRGYEDEIAHFVDSVIRGKEPEASIQDALASMKLLAAWEKSAKNGRAVGVR